MWLYLNQIQAKLLGGIFEALLRIKTSSAKPGRNRSLKVKNVYLDNACDRFTLDQEVGWIENTLTDLLNKYSKIMRVTSYSKRWWNKEVA